MAPQVTTKILNQRDNTKYLKKVWKVESLPTEGTFHLMNKSIDKDKPMLGAIGMPVNFSILSPTVKNPHHEQYGK